MEKKAQKVQKYRLRKKIVLPKEPEPEKKDYSRWTKYIIAAVFLILFFILLRGKKEKIEIQEPETFKPPALPEAPPPPMPKKNALPEILSIKLSPKVVYPGDKIKTEVEGKDEDGDAVTFYHEWRKNDEILQGETSNELDTSRFKKGDIVTLYVTPFDGKEKGKMRWSPTLMIANRPPEITSIPATAVSNGKYIYEVKAIDSDGDTLTFSLETGPPGMTIDPSTGVVRWDIPPPGERDLKSVPGYDIMIAVTDGDAKAFQGFTLNLQMEGK